MGTAAEERFDAITRRVRARLGTTSALVTLVGERRNWMKSADGVDLIDEPRDTSFCQHTILACGILEIEDAMRDPRVSDSPWAPSCRFYAGVALLFEGQPVGTLCVSGTEPRRLTDEERAVLTDHAELVMREIAMTTLAENAERLAAVNEELHLRASVDELTRMNNRASILAMASHELEVARAMSRPLGVIMLDVDFFKAVNTEFGHLGGDSVLRAVAQRIRYSLRVTDQVGRYGGEEFLVLLPGAGQAETAAIADRIRQEVSRAPITDNAREIMITVSAGCTVGPEGSRYVNTLIQAADDALHSAKEGGRNRVETRWLTPSMAVRRA